MSTLSRDDVLQHAMALPLEDREAIAEALLLTVDGGDRESVDAAWAEEVERRMAAYRQGQVKGVDPRELSRQLREKFER